MTARPEQVSKPAITDACFGTACKFLQAVSDHYRARRDDPTDPTAREDVGASYTTDGGRQDFPSRFEQMVWGNSPLPDTTCGAVPGGPRSVRNAL